MMPRIADLSIRIAQERRQHRPVRVMELPRAERVAGPGDLVPGREERDPKRPSHSNLGQAERAEQGQVCRPESAPGLEGHGSGGEVLAGEAAVGPALQDPRAGGRGQAPREPRPPA
jgi:hypothetical protein